MSVHFSAQNSAPDFENEIEIELPPQCTVVMYNDDYTTKDFVVELLISIFDKGEVEANFLMEKIHTEGSAVVGIYTYDIAVTKAGIATSTAKKSGFPLRVEVKKQ